MEIHRKRRQLIHIAYPGRLAAKVHAYHNSVIPNLGSSFACASASAPLEFWNPNFLFRDCVGPLQQYVILYHLLVCRRSL